jgi:hypothetical protein
MMTGKQLYEVWAPTESSWSPWVSPALFAQMECREDSAAIVPGRSETRWYEERADPESAVIVDLPGADSFQLAMTLAALGYRPVPVINASPGPLPLLFTPPSQPLVVLDMSGLLAEICASSRVLHDLRLGPGAPPAFILDSLRLKGNNPVRDDVFDNRWMIFPQDFPSARFLAEHKIKRVILVQVQQNQPQDDLSHVLLRWQQAGIEILAKSSGEKDAPARLSVPTPSQFKASWYRALAIMGFRRSSVGGFGSFIPETSSAG